jgi:hypothetical protein
MNSRNRNMYFSQILSLYIFELKNNQSCYHWYQSVIYWMKLILVSRVDINQKSWIKIISNEKLRKTIEI